MIQRDLDADKPLFFVGVGSFLQTTLAAAISQGEGSGVTVTEHVQNLLHPGSLSRDAHAQYNTDAALTQQQFVTSQHVTNASMTSQNQHEAQTASAAIVTQADVAATQCLTSQEVTSLRDAEQQHMTSVILYPTQNL